MKKLYRSRESNIIAGVCGGFGEYFNIDPVIVRIIFLLLIPAGGTGIIAYIIAWIIVPLRPANEVAEPPSKEESEAMMKYLPGLALIIIGAAFLITRIWGWLSFGHIWPAALIIIGAFLIYRAVGSKKEQ
ncbi:MAG: PspC domain-containing protein [candidate division Zixibacteria bacterium]|jgi:phage shock protein PspC (stress-responsive transcriptional regulator)|nr:PspC domain-containing protein [candidate division Zixibacteria bacterium]NIR62757.1 PspC domain-containing protein [candidate division Zixibacteria bacterium]NIS17209.1 PspC domain-containing protein [candidate division Zixibacteria bacterium]NIS44827.1 PspC domain-containing protein [candidate division Zixibacteria bacterium]NIT53562.1 PspC domain-containing protein [candidate division Zixibacteria bacterium]